jgi:hypothetical protein
MRPQSTLGGSALPRAPLRAAVPPPTIRRRRPTTIRVELPDSETLELPAAPWVALAQSAARSNATPTLAVRELSRPHAAALMRTRGDTQFGSCSFALLSGTRVLAVLTAANAREQHVDDRLGLSRENTVELSRLCTLAPGSGSDRLLGQIWWQHLALSDWPYYQHVAKVALICYPARSGAAAAISRSDGWQQQNETLWVYWLERPPASTPSARRPIALAHTAAKAQIRAAA